MVCNNQCLYQADAASTNQPQDKNLNLRQLKCQRCCMLEPPYILNLTNISFSLQVNYSLVKQLSTFFLYYPHRTQQEDRNHIISEKKQHNNLKFAPSITYCFRDILSKLCLFVFLLQKLKTEKPDYWF